MMVSIMKKKAMEYMKSKIIVYIYFVGDESPIKGTITDVDNDGVVLTSKQGVEFVYPFNLICIRNGD